MAISEDTITGLQAMFEVVLPHLDERSARLVMAAEATRLGHGGIVAVHRATGASKSRISAGVAELESALSWTTLSTRHLARELTDAGHPVSSVRVATLLKEQGFSLQANRQADGGKKPS